MKTGAIVPQPSNQTALAHVPLEGALEDAPTERTRSSAEERCSSPDAVCPDWQSSKRIQARTHATTCIRQERASGSACQAIRLALRCHCH